MAILQMTQRGPVAELTMNAPERLNALSDEMLDALQTRLDQLATDPKVRVITLAGSGKAFCAGHDLRQMTAMRQAPDDGAAAFKDLFDRCARVMARIQSMPQPVIAQVHGIATAAGCQLVATCDMAVAATGTRFGVNGVNIGLFCSTPMVALSRNIPRKQAFEMLTTGGFITAERAETLGLINRTCAPEDLAKETAQLADLVASKLGAAVKIGKSAFYNQMSMTPADAYAYTGDVMVENVLRDDTAEGINAFLEKRDPDWDQ
ncbi:enoyl-CoA hydratase [Sulfitobacter sp. M57]|uniref:enoyl-CoA hydratase n=1 Tax=unclassified Sulfitobacter TaxID=196795 RepID=UPI0023E0D3F7|nr:MULTISPECIES: enoyl-CoA hydratase [unclassified Sulfitobacter]MDF3413663.1 enoyl-CoA hydratase [Sulfitobacter sp. KE5]MDF3421056.1 enoyl-CoA hydratase [Sulfitobacter sp. KE43]MDF3432209.1 enoyl-CoA hydratase [Sulfitobacter sp. KE42]MDF3457848.1 enoyl-CoA hydratase [Sulfitobacter sp. S74]MDF3461749.1 enoyl-CoA hydratase [Sulfitobacter sp. Ks18]